MPANLTLGQPPAGMTRACRRNWSPKRVNQIRRFKPSKSATNRSERTLEFGSDKVSVSLGKMLAKATRATSASVRTMRTRHDRGDMEDQDRSDSGCRTSSRHSKCFAEKQTPVRTMRTLHRPRRRAQSANGTPRLYDAVFAAAQLAHAIMRAHGRSKLVERHTRTCRTWSRQRKYFAGNTLATATRATSAVRLNNAHATRPRRPT